MRVCDYIASYLYDYGVRRVYGLMGGGASGLNDGFIKHGKIKYICHHHEQGAGYAAFGEAKYTNQLSVLNPTTGCGGTNVVTPVLNAWQDAAPLLVISGNVRLLHTSNYLNKTKHVNIRKYGVQEHDIINTIKNITKYSNVVEHPSQIKRMLGEAIYYAEQGRKGPVWLDIPGDVQTAPMPEQSQEFVSPIITYFDSIKFVPILELIKNSKRPLVLAGNGIHISDQREQFKNFIKHFDIPFVSSYLARDLMPADDRHNIGTIGIKGSRAGNFIMQHCDLLFVLGCSLNSTHTGYDEKQFSPLSKKIMIDIDNNEYMKNTVNVDQFIHCDLKDFFRYTEIIVKSRENYQRWKENNG